MGALGAPNRSAPSGPHCRIYRHASFLSRSQRRRRFPFSRAEFLFPRRRGVCFFRPPPRAFSPFSRNRPPTLSTTAPSSTFSLPESFLSNIPSTARRGPPLSSSRSARSLLLPAPPLLLNFFLSAHRATLKEVFFSLCFALSVSPENFFYDPTLRRFPFFLFCSRMGTPFRRSRCGIPPFRDLVRYFLRSLSFD